MRIQSPYAVLVCAGIAASSGAHGQLAGWWPEYGLPDFAREDMCSFVIGDTAYVCGGRNAFLSGYTSELQAFDATTGLWSERTAHPREEVVRAEAFTLNGQGYVLGGQYAWAMNELYSYEPAMDDWTPRASIPLTTAYGGWGFAVNGKGYVVGLQNDTSTWEYDPVADSWTQRAATPGNSSSFHGFVVNGTPYVIEDFGVMFAYDPLLDAWTSRAQCPMGFGYGLFAFELNGSGYITGLSSGGPPTDEVLRYDPLMDAWTSDLAFQGAPRGNGCSFTVGGKGYVCGGVGGVPTTYYSDMWSTEPAPTSVVPQAHAALPGITVSATAEELVIEGAELSGFQVINALGALQYLGRMQGTRTIISTRGWSPGTYAVVSLDAPVVARFVKE